MRSPLKVAGSAKLPLLVKAVTLFGAATPATNAVVASLVLESPGLGVGAVGELTKAQIPVEGIVSAVTSALGAEPAPPAGLVWKTIDPPAALPVEIPPAIVCEAPA